MSKNNAIINNNYGRLQDLTLIFKIPKGMQKNVFEIFRRFWHALSKRFASPGLIFKGLKIRESNFGTPEDGEEVGGDR